MSVVSPESTAASANTPTTTNSNAPTPDGARHHTEHGRERKAQLLEVAGRLFAEHGYSSTRVADICREAGVAKGLFYWYFPTKQALFSEHVRAMRQRLRRSQAAAMDPTADAVTRIADGAEASVLFIADHAAHYALLDVERSDPDIADILADGAAVYLDDIRALVLDAQRAGQIPGGPPDLVAVGVVGAVSSFSSSFRNGRFGSDLSAPELARFVRRWILNALA